MAPRACCRRAARAAATAGPSSRSASFAPIPPLLCPAPLPPPSAAALPPPPPSPLRPRLPARAQTPKSGARRASEEGEASLAAQLKEAFERKAEDGLISAEGLLLVAMTLLDLPKAVAHLMARRPPRAARRAPPAAPLASLPARPSILALHARPLPPPQVMGGLMLLALHGPGGLSLDQGAKKSI